MIDSTERPPPAWLIIALTLGMAIFAWLGPFWVRFIAAGVLVINISLLLKLDAALRKSLDRAQQEFQKERLRADKFECHIVGHCKHPECVKDENYCCWCGEEMERQEPILWERPRLGD